jgi:hypothetical protein
MKNELLNKRKIAKEHQKHKHSHNRNRSHNQIQIQIQILLIRSNYTLMNRIIYSELDLTPFQ